MFVLLSLFLMLLSLSGFNAQAQRLAGDCAMVCNDLRTTVLTMAICADAKKTLPRPKVGDFCSIAMEQGFSDACVSLCMGQPPTPRLAQTCRSASIEMPRPTVRKWCEHGYTVGFQKTVQDLRTYFLPPKEEELEQPSQNEVRIEPIVTEVVEPLFSENSFDSNAAEQGDQPVLESNQGQEQDAFVHNEEINSGVLENVAVEEIREAELVSENESVPPVEFVETGFDTNPGTFVDQNTEQDIAENVPVEDGGMV